VNRRLHPYRRLRPIAPLECEIAALRFPLRPHSRRVVTRGAAADRCTALSLKLGLAEKWRQRQLEYDALNQ